MALAHDDSGKKGAGVQSTKFRSRNSIDDRGILDDNLPSLILEGDSHFRLHFDATQRRRCIALLESLVLVDKRVPLDHEVNLLIDECLRPTHGALMIEQVVHEKMPVIRRENMWNSIGLMWYKTRGIVKVQIPVIPQELSGSGWWYYLVDDLYRSSTRIVRKPIVILKKKSRNLANTIWTTAISSWYLSTSRWCSPLSLSSLLFMRPSSSINRVIRGGHFFDIARFLNPLAALPHNDYGKKGAGVKNFNFRKYSIDGRGILVDDLLPLILDEFPHS